MPLAGAAVGFLFGLVFGWLATQRTGVYFAMVTLRAGRAAVHAGADLELGVRRRVRHLHDAR